MRYSSIIINAVVRSYDTQGAARDEYRLGASSPEQVYELGGISGKLRGSRPNANADHFCRRLNAEIELVKIDYEQFV